METSLNQKYKIVILVDEELELGLDVERGERPSLLAIQEVLLLMCLQVRKQLDEE